MRRSHAVGVVAIIAALAVAPTIAAARPCSGMPIDRAFEEATLIVKGWLVSTNRGGLPESDSTGVIRVVRALKGAAAAQQEVTVTYFLCGLEYDAAMRPNGLIIAFVSASGSLVRNTVVLPASRRSADVISSDSKANLRAELLLGAVDANPSTVRAALGALAELDGTVSRSTLKRASSDGNLGVRVRALSWLTRFGDVDAVQELASVLSKWPFQPFGIPTGIRNNGDATVAVAHQDIVAALWSFASRFPYDASTAPRANAAQFVRTVAKIAASSDLFVRRAAVQALRGFKNPESFPVLVDALDDHDEYIRYDAMFALCIAMNAPERPCPAIPLFRSDEQKYIDRIRAWWAQQQP